VFGADIERWGNEWPTPEAAEHLRVAYCASEFGPASCSGADGNLAQARPVLEARAEMQEMDQDFGYGLDELGYSQ
jgi:hypothetical protein